ncbi:hypothetical protein CDV31_005208 [Fusarium ambrosium]|uniref:Major facilitator superfamily (MFS) profile domain-containing protein n=1 Tax=Fusarium ambrosium TaxID=131363 RepID=A0A428UKG9_9HYPO|nr:hypothetical protein CDV31_005208 [Fusarium ambrosium]
MTLSDNATTGNGEKPTMDQQLEHASVSDNPESGSERFNPKEVKRVTRKIDLRLLPVLTILYLLCYIDRGNIGNARVAGMNDDLGITPGQYNMALTVFFIPYTLFEVPSNIMLKLMRPSLWIAFLVISWGAVMICQGIVQNLGGLVTTRALLGLFEAGFFPASTYLLGEWYCRFELQLRLAVFFGAASLAGAFSGLLAAGLQQMDGVGGLAGWRWIFIMEGIVTVALGLVTPWALPDSPRTASFFSPEERALVLSRLELDSQGTGASETTERFQWHFIRDALLDWKIWFTVFVFWGNSIPLYGFLYTAPTIIRELGYESVEAQLLTVPVYTTATISTIIVAWLADRRKRRLPFIVFPYAISFCGLIGLLSIPHPRFPGLTYAFLFAVPAGIYPGVITLISWVSNNLAPSWKRAVGTALCVGLGNLGGIVGSNIFLVRESPRYYTGYGVSFACIGLAIISAIVLRAAYMAQNRKRELMSEDEIREKYTDNELMRLGDRSPLFRYVT